MSCPTSAAGENPDSEGNRVLARVLLCVLLRVIILERGLCVNKGVVNKPSVGSRVPLVGTENWNIESNGGGGGGGGACAACAACDACAACAGGGGGGGGIVGRTIGVITESGGSGVRGRAMGIVTGCVRGRIIGCGDECDRDECDECGRDECGIVRCRFEGEWVGVNAVRACTLVSSLLVIASRILLSFKYSSKIADKLSVCLCVTLIILFILSCCLLITLIYCSSMSSVFIYFKYIKFYFINDINITIQ